MEPECETKIKAPEDLIQFLEYTREGKFSQTPTNVDMSLVRLPNYYYPTAPIHLHGIR